MAANLTGLRVLLVTARYFPYMGGIETHNYEVARRMARQGVDVTILTSDASGRLPESEEVEGVQIRRVRAWPTERDYYFAPGVCNIIANGGWDILHCQGVHTFVPPLAMLTALRRKLPYVITFHTGGHSARWRNAIRGLQWSILHPLLTRAAHYIGVSRFEIDYFRQRLQLSDNTFDIIQNGSDLPSGIAPAAIDPQVKLILSVGRLERYKGHHRVIEALPQVRAQWPSARLLILGGGPYEADLRQIAQAQGVAEHVEIKMIPSEDRQAMASILARADLVTLLSESESNPVAIMEALALGRPALVADTTGFRELAERKLVQAIPLESSAAAVATAINGQLRNPLLPGKFELPTWDGCTRQILSVYERVLQRQPCVS